MLTESQEVTKRRTKASNAGSSEGSTLSWFSMALGCGPPMGKEAPHGVGLETAAFEIITTYMDLQDSGNTTRTA